MLWIPFWNSYGLRTLTLNNNNSAIAGFKNGTYESQDPLIQLRQNAVVGLMCPASTGLKLDYLPKIGPHIPVRSGASCIPWVKHRCQVVKGL